ncbi:DUF1684 domain-containing protein [Rhabdobacter roseus]|uniref:DUF1684 domain-containing protein n=1 Tax=Rhabdobacter roseus TaxID=1655419 RepID=A0A840TX99_9BACT|nr:DUF1684 domain-containing protein [Rhabdobacter roseus]MBB5285893.1 hypothetical protein [Rhabdobacter roseus]
MMKKSSKYLATLLLAVTLVAFRSDSTYENEIKAWHQKRVEALKTENGWLNLAGLFWLEEGENTIGGDTKNTIIFPPDRSDAFLGKIIVKDGKITFQAKEGAEVHFQNKPVTTIDLLPPGKPVVLEHKTLRWFIIQRGDKFAIRLRDLESPYLTGFKGIETFPINPDWRIQARFIPYTQKKVSITDITGRTYEQDSPGKLVFTVDGKEVSLDAVGTRERLHFIFADQSNKHETYGGGRFLDAEGPDADGNVWLDFNKATNPPCAFTPYATCPTPPKENRLSVAILAGEKRYNDLH